MLKNNHSIFGSLVIFAASMLFFACPSSPVEESKPAEDPNQIAADAILAAVGTAVSSASVKSGNLEYPITGGSSSAGIASTAQIIVDSVTVTSSSASIDKSQFVVTRGNNDMTLTINTAGLVEYGTLAIPEIGIVVRGKSEQVTTSSTKTIKVVAGSLSPFAGTIGALKIVAGSLAPSGGTINTTDAPVNIVAGSVGTLRTGSAPSSLVILLNDDTTMPSVLLETTSGSGSSNSSLVAGSIGTSSDFAVAGSFSLGSMATGLGGTLAITDTGSASTKNAAGTFGVFFGTGSTTVPKLVLNAEGLKYTVPAFGVLVTAYR
jgi:hypothetical protein